MKQFSSQYLTRCIAVKHTIANGTLTIGIIRKVGISVVVTIPNSTIARVSIAGKVLVSPLKPALNPRFTWSENFIFSLMNTATHCPMIDILRVINISPSTIAVIMPNSPMPRVNHLPKKNAPTTIRISMGAEIKVYRLAVPTPLKPTDTMAWKKPSVKLVCIL